MQELENRKQKFSSLPFIAAASLLLITNFAFTRRVSKLIKKRDGGCTERENGVCIGILEAAHIDHDKESPDYNNPSNGKTLCTKHHLEQHLHDHLDNGLTIEGNIWAIQMLANRLSSICTGEPFPGTHVNVKVLTLD